MGRQEVNPMLEIDERRAEGGRSAGPASGDEVQPSDIEALGLVPPLGGGVEMVELVEQRVVLLFPGMPRARRQQELADFMMNARSRRVGQAGVDRFADAVVHELVG